MRSEWRSKRTRGTETVSVGKSATPRTPRAPRLPGADAISDATGTAGTARTGWHLTPSRRGAMGTGENRWAGVSPAKAESGFVRLRFREFVRRTGPPSPSRLSGVRAVNDSAGLDGHRAAVWGKSLGHPQRPDRAARPSSVGHSPQAGETECEHAKD